MDGTRGREAAGVVLGGAALLLTVALASYSAVDPSFFVAAPGPPSNLIGRFGAFISAFLFQFLGLAAWLVPATLAVASLRRFRPGRKLHASAVAGLLIVAGATAVLLSLVAGNIAYGGSTIYAGGFLGQLAGRGLNSLLSEIGALVVTGTVLLVGLVLAARSSLAETTAAAAGAVKRAVPRSAARPNVKRGAAPAPAAPGRMRRIFRALRPRWPAFLTRKPKAAARAAAIERATEVDKATRRAPAPPPREGAPVLRGSAFRGADEPLPAGAGVPLDDDDDLADVDAGEEMVPAAIAPADLDDEAELPDPDPALDEAPRGLKMRRRAAKIVPRSRQAKLPVEFPPAASAKLPPIELLTPSPPQEPPDKQELLAIARQVESKCAEFDVDGSVTEIHPGPVVTTYEFRPNAGVKLARITALADDLALGLEAETVRLDRIPGRNAVGIEVPNRKRETIALRAILESDAFRRSTDILTVALGKTQEGDICCASLAKMPHVLVAGATGSGKSVGLNGIITSILYRARPDQVKFILIDPKMLELGLYEGMPHLLVPVVTDMKQAGNALKWAVREMDRRYRLLASCNTRHLDAFNKLAEANPGAVEKAIASIPSRGDGATFEAKPMPYVIIVVDELADMLMTTGQETEEAIARLAQKARAVGIHLVLATQRPSVDVLTGSIKANFPARIAYRVASKIDSRTILDAGGAERLLGAGDMLYRQPGSARLQRVHGAFVSEDENLRVVQWLRGQAKAEYDKSILEDPPEAAGESGEGGSEEVANDPMYRKAVRLVVATGQASTSFLQRRMRLGYSRAARIMDQMEQDGIIGPSDGARPRQVLVDAEFLERMDQQDQGEEEA